MDNLTTLITLLDFEDLPMAKSDRFRGKDFEGKWSIGAWAENHIIAAINGSHEFRVLQYGRSEVGPAERSAQVVHRDTFQATESIGKRPDLLLFDGPTYDSLYEEYDNVLENLVFLPEDDAEPIVRAAIAAIEAESSVWEGKKMPHFGRGWDRGAGKRKPLRELKSWQAPTVIVKKEDLDPLLAWQAAYGGKPIYIVHLFYDLAYMMRLEKIVELIRNGTVPEEIQDYGEAPKPIYKTYAGLAQEFGIFTELPQVTPFIYQTVGGKFKSDLYFSGGKLDLSNEAVLAWHSLGR